MTVIYHLLQYCYTQSFFLWSFKPHFFCIFQINSLFSKINFFIIFLCHYSLTQTHIVSVSSISFYFSIMKRKWYVALLNTDLYMLWKNSFMIIAVRPSKFSPTLGVLFSRFDHSDIINKLLDLFWKNSVALVLLVICIFVNFRISAPSFRHLKDALTWRYTLSFAEKLKWQC